MKPEEAVKVIFFIELTGILFEFSLVCAFEYWLGPRPLVNKPMGGFTPPLTNRTLHLCMNNNEDHDSDETNPLPQDIELPLPQDIELPLPLNLPTQLNFLDPIYSQLGCHSWNPPEETCVVFQACRTPCNIWTLCLLRLISSRESNKCCTATQKWRESLNFRFPLFAASPVYLDLAVKVRMAQPSPTHSHPAY